MDLFKRSFHLLFSVILFFCSAGLASPAPNKDATIAVASQHKWTGFYIGGNLGAVKHTMNVTDNQATSFYATIQEVSNPQLTGGLQLGYRRQLQYSSLTHFYSL